MVESETLYTAYLEGSLTLDAYGAWHHDGTLISHQRVQHFLHSHLVFDPELDTHVVRYGLGRATCRIERHPFFVYEIENQCDPWKLSLLGGRKEQMDPKRLRLGEEQTIVYLINEHDIASFTRSAWQTLAECVVDEKTLSIAGALISPPTL